MRFTYFTSRSVVCLAPLVALANEQPEAVRPASSSPWWSLFTIAMASLALLALAALAYVVRWLFRRRADRAKHDPGLLLHELCRAHGLSRRAERLLKQAAVAMGTPDPGRFFLEPMLLRQAEKCDTLKGSRRTISLLYEQLFGEDTP